MILSRIDLGLPHSNEIITFPSYSPLNHTLLYMLGRITKVAGQNGIFFHSVTLFQPLLMIQEFQVCGIGMRKYSSVQKVIQMCEYSNHSLQAPIQSI